MAQGSFQAQVEAWAAESKGRMLAVRNEATERVIEVMQEPGPSVATVDQAIAAGAGLGRMKKDGTRGVSKRAFGPITNPGGAGNLPVDTGFLRASLVIGRGEVKRLTTRPPEGGSQSYQWDDGQVSLVLGMAKIEDPIEARYTAVYARKAEYGGGRRRPRRFVALAAMQWKRIVAEVVADLKARAGG